jgi:hypothetical protein
VAAAELVMVVAREEAAARVESMARVESAVPAQGRS